MDEDKSKNLNETSSTPKTPHEGIFGEPDIIVPAPTDYDQDAGSQGKKLGVYQRFARFVSDDIVGGLILIGAAVLALLCANGPIREAYHGLATLMLDPGLGEAVARGGQSFLQSIHLSLSVEEWARDGILAIFFFTVGLELKEEFTHGSLHDPRTAGMPIIAAMFGMAGPALVYTAVTAISGDAAWHGWAIPTATDIAFAVAILQIFGRGLPSGARTFLLTLAVADDLGGIIVIALFYGTAPNLLLLIPVAGGAAVFSFLCRRRIVKWWLLIPLGVLTWYFMLASGIHATIAGVVLGMVVPADRREGEVHNLVERFSMKVSPISAAFAVPIFAFFAAGVNIVDTPGGVGKMLTNPVALAVMLALPLGKFLGIFGSVFVMEKFTPLHLEKGVRLADILPISFVAGIGFTVALLISHLSFRGDNVLTQAGSIGVVMGTFASVIIGAIALKIRISYRKTHAE